MSFFGWIFVDLGRFLGEKRQKLQLNTKSVENNFAKKK
jgi:hypothetical protein